MFNNDERLILTNEKGNKFFVSEATTGIQQYARQKGLEGIVAFILETKDGWRSYVLVRNGEIIAVDQTLDGIGCRLDVLAMVNHFTTGKGLSE